jgi:hypothetical protein
MDITVIGFRQGIPVPALQEALEQQNPDVVIEYPDEAWDYQVALDYSEAAWSLEYSKDATLLNGIGRLITNDQPIDDYGLSNNEVFASVSPSTAAKILAIHAQYHGRPAQIVDGPSPDEVLAYIHTWVSALDWSVRENIGLAFIMR